ncbi:unnamed protein product [Vitrella brassicaformis CCMP3155]|uniref:Palmitoyltransferase n=2 Tax=Vitrella brassicaformis TaxID=1169539 RepID=A0A0G4GBP5_VITBC|nr:unnamed protein product [Vitrella brassicaformis CCMP3155]|mmetsp:Transcript_30676/g.76178  ORF Transcript_30676/g.76178 Transcript_30676/m.76178 type:complete len:429 (+) Transcript_30676:256-1542(+)|eukprot:CEM26516.1 unnamed protein product [Vitrella brassicaformis CCMP3155]
MRSPLDPLRIVEVDEDLMALMPSQSCSCPELLIGPDGWRGDHDVCCDGRGLMARETLPSVWTTLLAKLAPVIWSVVVTLPWLYVHSDDLAGEREVLFHLVYMPVLTVVSIVVLFVLIVWREPGFCLRNPHPTEDHPRNTCKDVYVNGHRIWRKWCDTCKIWRPLRGKHCSWCDMCVDRFDHHCPWVSQCIGARNHPCFLLWLWLTSLLLLEGFTVNAKLLAYDLPKGFLHMDFNSSLRRFHWQSWVSLVWCLHCVAFGGFVGWLTLYHSWLALTNQTTNERYKRSYRTNWYFYSPNICANLFDFCKGLCRKSLVFVDIEEMINNPRQRPPPRALGGETYQPLPRDFPPGPRGPGPVLAPILSYPSYPPAQMHDPFAAAMQMQSTEGWPLIYQPQIAAAQEMELATFPIDMPVVTGQAIPMQTFSQPLY